MILVTGASGTIGVGLVKGLLGKGHQVRALVLPDDPFRARLEDCGCQIVTGDITRAATLEGVFDEVTTVYHLAAIILTNDPEVYTRVNVEGTRNMLAGSRKAAVEHFIYVSSASVVYPRTTPYSRSKRECERLVKAAEGLNYTIVRPTLVYEDHGGQEFVLFLDYLKKFPVVPFIGSGQAKKRPVHVDDLIDGLLKLAGCRRSYNQSYNLCGAEEISIVELAHLMLKHNGLEKPFISVPVPLCKLIALGLRAVMKNPPLTLSAIAGITQDASLDSSSAERDLGYQPIGVREGFQKCFPIEPRTRRSTACEN
jgi:nucleoside-diphosphate-sugar epimerase